MTIYKITNIINNKVYIGQTKSKPSKRWTSHKVKLRQGKHSNPHLQSAWIKYGETNFKFEVLSDSINDRSELNKLEVYWIEFYNSTNREKGYNIEAGGFENKIVSESTRLKMSKNASSETNKARLRSLRVGIRLSEEHKNALIRANTGREVSKETRDKIAKSNTGKTHNNDTKAKMSQIKKGKPGIKPSEETKNKISQSNKGRKFSVEHRLKLSKARRERSAKIKQTPE